MSQKPEPSIRERRPEDLPALGELLRIVHDTDGYPVEGVADPIAWLDTPGLLGSWVATIDNDLVGHVSLSEPRTGDAAPQLLATQTGTTITNIAVLGRLFVAPHGRGHALGRRLTQSATEAAQAGGRRAVLDVMLKDTAAISTYRALGWERIGTFTHSFGGDGEAPAAAYAAPQTVSARAQPYRADLLTARARHVWQ